MRVRDVEIALVLAREMKDAAARDVDASLRLEQLKEVFGAEELDPGERARIQTALQMAGLEPQPSLLEADPADPIRFAVAGGEEAAAPAPVAAVEAPAAGRQEFPTVGEFFGRFRRKRSEPEPVALEAEAEAEEPTTEEPEPVNGHVDGQSNGHHVDFLDEEELLHEEEYEEPERVAAEPEPAAGPARVEEIAALMLPLVAIPVLIASFAGWSFGLPFVALALIATGVLAGRRAGFFSTLRSSAAARTMLKATLLVTAVSLAVAIALANVGSGGNDKPKQPAAKKPAPTPPAAKAPEPAKPSKPKHRKTKTTPQSPPPDADTKGLVKAPPSTGTPTQTTPAPQAQQP